MTDKIRYRKPSDVRIWLDTALKKEREKYKNTPVKRDMIPNHELAQAWGYVVAGYFLIEQGLKAVLYVRNNEPPKTHVLSCLFNKLSEEDRNVLREYYHDFRHACPGMSSFPLERFDEFLKELDGDQNDHGSFDWRYFLTEEGSGASMPLVSIDFMHEVVYGCMRLMALIYKKDNEAVKATYSWRLQRIRSRFQIGWLTVRMNSPGWEQEGSRIEILWGPDYAGRYDYFVFKGGTKRCFGQLPDAKKIKLEVIDKRRELESFDHDEGFRRIWVSGRHRESESSNMMS